MLNPNKQDMWLQGRRMGEPQIGGDGSEYE